jgi:Ca-activated chloride channel family protein
MMPMIEWRHPFFLALIPLFVALLLWAARRQPAMSYASTALVRNRASLARTFAFLPELLFGAGLLCGLAALARPELTNREILVTSQGIDIMLALDVSGSMDAADFVIGGREATRLDVAKAVMARFVDGRPNDRIGLVVFGEEAFTQVPLTLDHEGYKNFLAQVTLGMAGARSTALGDGLAVAVKRLKELDAPSRVIILLTDGQNNAGLLAPSTAAEAAAALGIRVYTIGVGGRPQRGLMGLLGRSRRGDLDEDTLRRIAETTNAEYHRADDTEALLAVYASIDLLEKSTAEVRERIRTEPRHHPWILASLALLLASRLLSGTILRRLP